MASLSLIRRFDRNEKYWKLVLHECGPSSPVQLVRALPPLHIWMRSLLCVLSIHFPLSRAVALMPFVPPFAPPSPPLTQFFLDCSGLVRTDKKPALCKSYQKLISELWHKKR